MATTRAPARSTSWTAREPPPPAASGTITVSPDSTRRTLYGRCQALCSWRVSVNAVSSSMSCGMENVVRSWAWETRA
ncbi:hypothetical protein OIB37_00740 [Streptomyces sp. NBC_00820]|uniref:hypothetical protein n=1 Tax=Streptomyces sp. NBC_00820 TaxID=2975842 RepID=UPI002ED4E103|nr:hypothetical protein OIB37_00740 [Streptomyces sp. NBC_00820]